jgi:hypothetical protein
MVELPESPSILFAGMAGSRMPVVVSHGEGRAVFASPEQQASALVAMRYLDHAGQPTEVYPYNPNGSPAGVTGFTTADGRFHDHDAAPRAGLPQRADVLAPGRMVDARLARLPLAADVPQRAALGGIGAPRSLNDRGRRRLRRLGGLLDLRLGAQVGDELLNLFLLQALRNLLLDLVERRRRQRTAVFEQDHVITKVGLDRRFGVLALARPVTASPNGLT